MSKCKCAMAQSVTGDGCRYCQPQEYIDRLEEWLDDERQQLKQAEARVAELEPDAMRYRFLRSQHWSDGALCVVKDPKRFVKLGAYCPSGEYLDSVIDEAERAGGEK